MFGFQSLEIIRAPNQINVAGCTDGKAKDDAFRELSGEGCRIQGARRIEPPRYEPYDRDYDERNNRAAGTAE